MNFEAFDWKPQCSISHTFKYQKSQNIIQSKLTTEICKYDYACAEFVSHQNFQCRLKCKYNLNIILCPIFRSKL